MKRITLSTLRLVPVIGDRRRGHILVGSTAFPCAIGRGGISHAKREGDGATPAGRHPVLRGWFRADRWKRPRTLVPLTRLHPADGWCDDPRDRRYNRLVTLPCTARHEDMWREDHLYDAVFDLGWNARPRVLGRGSAIFMHCAREKLAPTEGCIAFDKRLLPRMLARIGPGTRIIVGSRPVPRKHRAKP